jgi:hypothetical protein
MWRAMSAMAPPEVLDVELGVQEAEHTEEPRVRQEVVLVAVSHKQGR